MASPIQIADAKISLAATSAITSLQNNVHAIHNRASAKGMLRSGNTIIEVKNECVLTLRSLGDIASQELCWVLSQSFFASSATIDACNALARRSFGAARGECSAVLRKTVALCGDDRHFEITDIDLGYQEQHSLMAISLTLDSRYSELKFQWLRTLLGLFQRILSLLVGHGHP